MQQPPSRSTLHRRPQFHTTRPFLTTASRMRDLQCQLQLVDTRVSMHNYSRERDGNASNAGVSECAAKRCCASCGDKNKPAPEKQAAGEAKKQTQNAQQRRKQLIFWNCTTRCCIPPNKPFSWIQATSDQPANHIAPIPKHNHPSTSPTELSARLASPHADIFPLLQGGRSSNELRHLAVPMCRQGGCMPMTPPRGPCCIGQCICQKTLCICPQHFVQFLDPGLICK